MTCSEAKDVLIAYIGHDVPIKAIGAGIDGHVFLVWSSEPIVVKIFEEREKYRHEVEAYFALGRAGIQSVLGLKIPEFRNFDDDRLIIEISLVRPPFLLDFASVRFEEPDFDDGIYAGWHKRMEFRFGSNTWFVIAVYNALAAHGIYYLDFHRGNLDFTGIEGINQEDQGLDEEFSP